MRKRLSISLLFFVMCAGKNPVEPDNTSEWTAINNGLLSIYPIQSIAVLPQGSKDVYIGTINGLYKSTDNGEKWEKIGSDLTSQDAKSLAVHPANSNIVFVGTWGKGVFISKDGGSSWESAWDSAFDPRISRIIVTSGDKDVVWVGSENGLYKSEDYGQNWTASYSNGTVTAIAAKPDNPNTVFIGVRYQGIYKTLDGGDNWQKCNNGLYEESGNVSSPNSFAFNSQASQIFISTAWVDLYETEDEGMHWVKVAPQLMDKNIISLIIDPHNSDKMWAASEDHGIYSSHDGGDSWQESNTGLETMRIKQLVLACGEKTILYAGTQDKGIYRFIEN